MFGLFLNSVHWIWILVRWVNLFEWQWLCYLYTSLIILSLRTWNRYVFRKTLLIWLKFFAYYCPRLCIRWHLNDILISGNFLRWQLLVRFLSHDIFAETAETYNLVRLSEYRWRNMEWMMYMVNVAKVLNKKLHIFSRMSFSFI